MGATRVLIIGDSSVFGEGLRLRLNSFGNLKVSVIVPVNEGELKRGFREFDPQVIVFDESLQHSISARLIALLFKYSHGRKLFTISSEDNLVFAYQSEQFLISDSQDFYNLIHPDLAGSKRH
jgi:hypothetical protein